jgi:HD-GYP domain-containing protein (c-di-GMP phosphodiesterase class II)
MDDRASASQPNRALYEAVVLWRGELVDRISSEPEFGSSSRTAAAFVTALLERLEAEALSGERNVLNVWLKSLASLEALADYPALIDYSMANLIALGGVLAPRSLGRTLLARRDEMLAAVRSATPSAHGNDPAFAAARAVHAMVEHYDEHYGKHSVQASDLAATLGKALLLPPSEVQRLRLAGLVHDAGMVTIPSAVLGRTSELSHEEWQAIRRHPETGARMIEEVPLLADIAPAVKAHHERYDGTGYPDGLAAQRIPMFARILAVADAFEALTSARPHRPALSRQAALAAIEDGRGTQWDPVIVDVLNSVMSGLESHSNAV